MEQRKFFSKILLFGEYSIIQDSMGLATSYPLFEGHLRFQSAKTDSSVPKDQELKALSQYLDKMQKNEKMLSSFDLSSFKFDIGQGLYFKSTIPHGYGLGSSGALCAAIYDRYVEKRENAQIEKVLELKKYFALIESHFHGASSGIDPLICYLNTSLLIRAKNKLSTVRFPDYETGDGAIFLLNTGRSRRTEPLVNLFLEKCSSNQEFNQLCKSILLSSTNTAINSFLERDTNVLYESFKEISSFQYIHFTPMIPKLFQDVWKEGLSSDSFYLKLCGAGGGGFLLGISKNFHKIADTLKDYELRPLFRF